MSSTTEELRDRLAGKVSKQSVRYSQGVAHRKCSLCSMWRPPASCSLVAGRISPEAVCDKFERKRAK
jgi:hypothetical protein